MENNRKPRVFSGIQPTGGFTLGNYIGAVRNWNYMQDEFDCVYSVVNLHSLTVRNEPAALRRQTREAAAMLLAYGVDPARSVLFVQADVPAHTELSWLLSCYTQFGELSRMTQFKEKGRVHPENVNAGLFNYPVLMAADILLYDSSFVPIGDDQKQHLEICRDIATRFNGIYGDTFVLPEGYYPKVGARIMSLQQPAAKMSKSDENENARVMLTDDRDTILRKFRRAVTDSGSEVRAGEGKAGIVNLMSIYSALTGKSFAGIEREFEGRGYGDFKLAVGETVADALEPARKKYNDYTADRAYVDGVLKEGAEKAAAIANKVLARAARKVGLNYAK